MADLYLYIDESGDLGFSERSSKFFVVAYMIAESPFEMDTKLKRLLKKLHQRKDYARKSNELKFTNSKDSVRREVLRTISLARVEVGFVVVKKEKVSAELRVKPTILYNYTVVHNIMRGVLKNLASADRLHIIIDKSLGKFASDEFNVYARYKASWLLKVEKQRVEPIGIANMEIQHRNSESDPCLQAADFLAGACYYKFERKNDCYYRIIEGQVKYYDFLWN